MSPSRFTPRRSVSVVCAICPRSHERTRPSRVACCAYLSRSATLGTCCGDNSFMLAQLGASHQLYDAEGRQLGTQMARRQGSWDRARLARVGQASRQGVCCCRFLRRPSRGPTDAHPVPVSRTPLASQLPARRVRCSCFLARRILACH